MDVLWLLKAGAPLPLGLDDLVLPPGTLDLDERLPIKNSPRFPSASISHTADTYGHVQPERHEAAVEGLDRYLRA